MNLRRLCLTALTFGMVSAATITVDFTNGNNVNGSGSATISGGSATVILESTSAPTSVGTGVIDSFVRIQNSSTEQGYNTDATGVMDNKAGTFTHSLLLSSLDEASRAGFYTFLLDINQTSDHPLLSLDDIKIFVAATGNLSDAALSGLQSHATQVYDFQAANTCGAVTGQALCTSPGAAHNEILLNYSLNSGSGNGFDMFLYVPISIFEGVPETSYVYLYSAFGGLGGNYATNDGFEEWAGIKAVVQNPEPSTFSILLIGIAALTAGGLRRRWRQAAR